MRIGKLEKDGFCFISGCFVKPFKIIIIFFFNRSFRSQNIDFLCKLVCRVIFTFLSKNHGRRLGFERGSWINWQRGTNVENLLQNSNMKIFLSVSTYHIYIYSQDSPKIKNNHFRRFDILRVSVWVQIRVLVNCLSMTKKNKE